jgi:hypothetical protein
LGVDMITAVKPAGPIDATARDLAPATVAMRGCAVSREAPYKAAATTTVTPVPVAITIAATRFPRDKRFPFTRDRMDALV